MTVYKQSEGTETMRVDEQFMVMHLGQCTVTELNEVGGYCWELLREGRSAEELTEAVARKFGRPDGELAVDVDAFIRELAGIGLIAHG